MALVVAGGSSGTVSGELGGWRRGGLGRGVVTWGVLRVIIEVTSWNGNYYATVR